jgi:hypothetical protein
VVRAGTPLEVDEARIGIANSQNYTLREKPIPSLCREEPWRPDWVRSLLQQREAFMGSAEV